MNWLQEKQQEPNNIWAYVSKHKKWTRRRMSWRSSLYLFIFSTWNQSHWVQSIHFYAIKTPLLFDQSISSLWFRFIFLFSYFFIYWSSFLCTNPNPSNRSNPNPWRRNRMGSPMSHLPWWKTWCSSEISLWVPTKLSCASVWSTSRKFGTHLRRSLSSLRCSSSTNR